MREEKNQEVLQINEKRLLDVSEVCYYLGLGRNRGVEFAKSIGAERKVGRRYLYDRRVIDKYLDEQAGYRHGER